MYAHMPTLTLLMYDQIDHVRAYIRAYAHIVVSPYLYAFHTLMENVTCATDYVYARDA